MNPTTPQARPIVVFGSLNLDLVARVARIPAPGETVLARDYHEYSGGKGANQAVGIARLGATVQLIGRVGQDAAGDRLLQSLAADGVDLRYVARHPRAPTGRAWITVDDAGQNAITVVPGANATWTADEVDRYAQAIEQAALVVLQLEVPQAAVVAAQRLAKAAHVPVLLDPAPVPGEGLVSELFACDCLSPNQTEAEQLTGIACTAIDSAPLVAAELLRRGAQSVALKFAEQGAYWQATGTPGRWFPAIPVDVVDSTAAGDAFTAALAVGWAQGLSMDDRLRWAIAAGAWTVTQAGAQSALPTRVQLRSLAPDLCRL